MGLTSILAKMLVTKSFSTERGRIKMFGKMDWTMQPAISLAYVLQQVGEKNGEDFLFSLGYESGRLAVDDIIRTTGISFGKSRLSKNIFMEMLEFIGTGRMRIIRADIEKDGHHDVVIQVKDNPAVECARKMYGKRSKVCAFFMGLYSAHGEKEFGVKNLKLKESGCICRGNPYHCVWESRW